MASLDKPSAGVRHSLDRSLLAGVAWTGAAKWSTQILSWAITILVARILTPSDFGLVTMATVFLSIVMMLSEFGVGVAVITLRELPDKQLRQLNAFSVLLGAAGTSLTALLAYPLGAFFRAPALPPVLLLVGITFLVTSLQTVPAALLRRELRFRTLALVDLARGILVPAVTLVGALLGLRYWALALGSVTGAVIASAMVLVLRRVGFERPSAGGLAHALHFSRDILIGRLAWVVYQDGDFAVAGRRLGQAAVGDYSMAWTLATAPIEKVTMVLSEVTPSLFSAVQEDRLAIRRYFLNLTEILCLATFPASVGLALVSRDLVAALLGANWAGAAAPLALLALYAGARSVAVLYPHVLTATRDTRFLMWLTIAGAVCLLTGFVVGSSWGPTGIAAAWLLIHPVLSLISLLRVRRAIGVRLADYVGALRLGLEGAVVMAGVLLALQLWVMSGWTPMARLATAIPVGAGTYLLTTVVLHRQRLRHILAWFRRSRSGGAVEPLAP